MTTMTTMTTTRPHDASVVALRGALETWWRAVLDPDSHTRFCTLVDAAVTAAFPDTWQALWWTDVDPAAAVLASIQHCLELVIRERQNLPDFALPAGIPPAVIVQRRHDELLHLGRLAPLWRHPRVEDVYLNGTELYARIDGELYHLDLPDPLFANEAAVVAWITPLLNRLGEAVGGVDTELITTLPDHARLTVVLPPTSLAGPSIAIRLHTMPVVSLDQLVGERTLPRGAARFLADAMRGRLNVIFSGHGGSGKTTVARATARAYETAPVEVRVLTIEDAVELLLHQLLPHCIAWRGRRANVEGKGGRTLGELVEIALTMGVEVIILGECRGKEALAVLKAMNTGHSGAVTTMHANGARDTIPRFAGMVLEAGEGIPLDEIYAMIGSNVHLIVYLGRHPVTRRRVVLEILEVQGVNAQRQVVSQLLWEMHDGALRRTLTTADVTIDRLRTKGVLVDPGAWEDDDAGAAD